MANVSLLATVADQAASQQAGGTASIMPTGVILPYGASNAPNGWLLCDGSAVSRTTFASLFAVLTANGTTFPYGSGDGSTTFNLPDLRGRFPRFNDSMGTQGVSGTPAAGAANRDTGRLFGSTQAQATAKNGLGATTSGSDGTHTHGIPADRWKYNVTASGGAYQSVDSSNIGTNGTQSRTTDNVGSGHGHTLTVSGDAETRPINISVNAIIKI